MKALNRKKTPGPLPCASPSVATFATRLNSSIFADSSSGCSLAWNDRRENRSPFPFADMSATQPPPSSVCVRRLRTPLPTSATTFLRRRDQRGASAVLPCRGPLALVRYFCAPFCRCSLVAARRSSAVVKNLSVLLTFTEPSFFTRRRSVSILRRFDAFSSRNRLETLIPFRVSVVGAPFFPERRFVRERVAAPSSFWEATRRPTPGETPK